jgi:hypothetical protein
MCIFIFSTTFVWNISHSNKNSVRYYHKCTQIFVYSTRFSCQILIKLEVSRQISEERSDVKFHENPSSGSRVVPCGRTDRRTDMTKVIITFRNFATASKNEMRWFLGFYVFTANFLRWYSAYYWFTSVEDPVFKTVLVSPCISRKRADGVFWIHYVCMWLLPDSSYCSVDAIFSVLFCVLNARPSHCWLSAWQQGTEFASSCWPEVRIAELAINSVDF